MNGTIDTRFPFFGFLILFSAIVLVSLSVIMALPAGAQDTSPGSVVADPLGTASFLPPAGWVRWDFWGTAAFSPTSEHEPVITFTVSPQKDAANNRADAAMRDYETTFSTHNYTLVTKENLSLGGWSGIRVLAQGTEDNTLFGRDYIWIQQYFTNNGGISLLFRGSPASFETYRDAVLKSFRSLTIAGHPRDGS